MVNPEDIENGHGSDNAVIPTPRLTHTVTSVASVERLEGRQNYSSWAFSMKMVLIKEGFWKTAVDVPEDTIVNEDLSLRALSTIGLNVHKRYFSHIKNCKTAREAWFKLKAVFEDGGFSQEINLLRKLCNIWLADYNTVEEYLDELMSTAQKLEELNFTVDDRWLVGLMLKGLPEEYNPMVMSLEN